MSTCIITTYANQLGVAAEIVKAGVQSGCHQSDFFELTGEPEKPLARGFWQPVCCFFKSEKVIEI